MTESFHLTYALNALWGLGIIDAWVRSSAAEQNTPPKTVATLRGVAAGLSLLGVFLLINAAWPGELQGPAADRMRLFLFKLGVVGCAVVGLDMAMRFVLTIPGPLASKQTLVHGLVGFSVLFSFPLKDSLRLGIDLGGGTLLTYTVKFDEEAVGPAKEKAAEDLIATLQRRVDPNNVMGLVWSFEGDKLTIQMPAAKVNLREQRGKWQAVRDQIAAQNIESARLVSLIKAAPTDAAAAAELKEFREKFASRKDAVTLVETTAAAAVRADEAQKAAAAKKDADDEKKKAAGVRAAKVKEFVAAVEKLEQGNLSLSKLEEALRIPPKKGVDYRQQLNNLLAAKAKAAPPQDVRAARLLELGQERPERKEQLLEAVAAYDNYRELVQTSVEDVEDLKRELQGAGILSFHILPQIGDPRELSDAGAKAAEKQLDELGRLKPAPVTADPNTANLGNFRWFRVDDEKEWRSKGYHLYKPQNRDQFYILGFDADQFAPDAAAGAAPTKRLHLKAGPQDPWKLTRVMPSNDDSGLPAVAFHFDDIGGARFGELTKANIGRLMMISIDDRAITAPNIEGVIRDRGIIRGRFTQKEVDSLVRKLSAGSLRAKISETPISEQTVGPTLGADNQKKGLNASLGSVIAVGGFLILYYLLAGAVAVTALLFNLLLLLGVMVFLNASMTLAGIAGLALSIAMSVDANVLIFERIRDERAAGLPLRQAVHNGYDRAFSAILDGNVTVVISGLILLWMGSGDIKSFGITLVLGVAISMFTALFATRVVFDILVAKGWITDLKFFKLIGKPKVDWMGMLPVFLIASGSANLLATNSFFGVPPVWIAILILPAIGVVALTVNRKAVGPNWLGFAAAVVVASVAGLGIGVSTSPDADVSMWGVVPAVGAGLAALGLALSAAGKAVGRDAAPASGHVHRFAYGVITLAGLAIAAGFVRVAVVGTPRSNLDIEFSAGTVVQTSFKDKLDIEEVRAAVQSRLADGLDNATVTESSEPGLFNIQPTGKLPAITGVRFNKDDPRFADAAAVQRHVRSETAPGFRSAAIQSIDVGDPQDRPHYLIKTLENNVEMVDGALRSAFAGKLDVREAIRPPGKPVLHKPVPGGGEDRGLLAAGANAAYYAEFAGGVQLLQGEGGAAWRYEVPQKLEDVEERISREINRVGGRDNAVSNFKVLGDPRSRERDDPPGTFRSVEILGLPPANSIRLPPEDSPEFARQKQEWERLVAGPFASLVAAALSTRQAFERIDNFNPQVAAQFVRGALSAVFLAWLAIIAYMWFRFGEARWGVAGVVCLVHDVCVSLGLLLAGKFVADTAVGRALLIDAFRIDLTVVAAVLTIIGSSINDTIVVFDRIREVRGRSGTLSVNLINDSINETMSRTLVTNLLIGLAVGILYFFGGPGIHGLAFMMLVGTMVGTYSTVAIAAPLLLAVEPAAFAREEKAQPAGKPDAPKPATAA